VVEIVAVDDIRFDGVNDSVELCTDGLRVRIPEGHTVTHSVQLQYVRVKHSHTRPVLRQRLPGEYCDGTPPTSETGRKIGDVRLDTPRGRREGPMDLQDPHHPLCSSRAPKTTRAAAVIACTLFCTGERRQHRTEVVVDGAMKSSGSSTT
jgi:hypothetical protein